MWNVWNEEFKINTPKHFALKNVSFRYKIYIQYLFHNVRKDLYHLPLHNELDNTM